MNNRKSQTLLNAASFETHRTEINDFMALRKYQFTKYGLLVLLLFVGLLKSYSQTTTRTFNTAGANQWKCPPGVTTVAVECWGGGGAGGGNGFVENGAGGGAGGAYVKAATLPVTANTIYTVTVG